MRPHRTISRAATLALYLGTCCLLSAKSYPPHWGAPPATQTRDIRPLPGGFGSGSSTLAKWIQAHLDQDAAAKPPTTVTGALMLWHPITLTFTGPSASEKDTSPNPFTDFNLLVTFTHASGSPTYQVPGYFAADGNAADTSATSGNQWRAHFSPDQVGTWNYRISFTQGKNAALDGGGSAVPPLDGETGSFVVASSDKSAPDFRAKGRLDYVGKHHLQFAGSKDFFLKAGPDAPETLLAYTDFDNTHPSPAKKLPLKTWTPHLQDWHPGDPTWQNGKGKGLIGALNYLSSKGVNAFSFLTYNAGGDGDNIWPFVERNDKLHYDCSKLDQWAIVFDHATTRGLHLHFKMQENEMDDNRTGHASKEGQVPESLDGGALGPERKLYCRELIARFGHNLALNWNLGEESTQSNEEIRAMIAYLHATDPYHHPIVLHTFPNQQDLHYDALTGNQSLLTGTSLQNTWNSSHQRTLHWLTASAEAGKPWVVAHDEQNPAGLGVPPDPGYQGFDGTAVETRKKPQNTTTGDVSSKPYTLHDIRKLTLWGNLMAGGAGVEYYFGYSLPQNDLSCEDFRSRAQSWDYCRIALNFFRDEKIPFAEMKNADSLIGNPTSNNSKFCLAKPGELYLIYLPNGGETSIDLSSTPANFTVKWFNPRDGSSQDNGPLNPTLIAPSTDDWLAVIRKSPL